MWAIPGVVVVVLMLVATAAPPAGRPSPSVTRQLPCGPLQARIDAAPTGSILDLSGCLYEGSVIMGRSLTLSGGTIIVPHGEAGITVAADNITLVGLDLVGPQSTRFDANEIGIVVSATASAPVRNLTIRNVEISSFGNAGISLLDVSGVTIERDRIHDIVYAGVIVMSGSVGTISGNVVQRIGVVGSEANEGNAYGITLTRQSGTLAVSPPSSDFTVAGNTVEDVPTWHALDTHAGRRILFTGNTVRRASRPIFITTDGGTLRASHITVSGNRLEAPSPVTWNLQAITTYATDNVTITGNTAIGWHQTQFFGDYRSASTNLVVTGNTLLP